MKQLSVFLQENYPNVHLNDSSNPGEGEIKLIKWLLEKKNPGKIAIFGSDADLVLIATAARPLVNLSIVSKDKKGFNWINLDQLWKKLPGNREEISLICMLLGNDYFPGLPGINYNNFWDFYSKRLFRYNKFCHKNWIDYFQQIELPDSIQKKCTGSPREYFKALLWCLEMYSKGVCSNYEFKYEGSPPSPQACIDFLQSGPKLQVPKSNLSPLTESEALLILMPRWGKEYLPEELKPALEYIPLKHWYPEECQICLNFRQQVSALNKLHAQTKEYTMEIAELNLKYQNHKSQAHPKIPIPIKEIKNFLKI